MERDHGSTLKPNSQSLEFMDLLYAEYLPNFSSKNFNVGMDEPWELGQGWSAGEVKRLGKGKVYLKHLSGIRKLVEKHHKNMQFWADVLLEEPENAKLLPMVQVRSFGDTKPIIHLRNRPKWSLPLDWVLPCSRNLNLEKFWWKMENR